MVVPWHIGHGIVCGDTSTGNTFGSTSVGKEIVKKDGNGKINLINWEYKVKTPFVVCLDNNYDTGVFAFFL